MTERQTSPPGEPEHGYLSDYHLDVADRDDLEQLAELEGVHYSLNWSDDRLRRALRSTRTAHDR